MMNRIQIKPGSPLAALAASSWRRVTAFVGIMGLVLLPAAPCLAEIDLVAGEPGADAAPTGRVGPVPAETLAADVIKFRNGDTLHGGLLSLSPATGVRWKSTEASDVIVFGTANLSEVTLGARPGGAGEKTHRSVVQLTNGDRLAGDLVALDKEALTLNTWYAGAVQLRRPTVQAIMPNLGRTETLYSGPAGLDGWVRGGNREAWEFKNGAFYSIGAGSIARDLKLPDTVNIEFELAWRGFLQVIIAMYSDNLEQFYAGGGYALTISHTNVYVQRGRANQGFTNLDQGMQVDSFQRKNRVRLNLLVDKNKRTIALLVDGNLIRQWTDPAEFAGRGGGLMFMAQGQGQIRVSNLTVSSWDGRVEVAGGETAPDEDLVRLVNGDKVSGQLESIVKNEATFVTSYATLKIPLERVAQIEFSSKKAEVARRQAADLRAFFTEGGRLTIAVEKIAEQKVTGGSENFGSLELSLAALRRLQFHIYDPEAEAAAEDDW